VVTATAPVVLIEPKLAPPAFAKVKVLTPVVAPLTTTEPAPPFRVRLAPPPLTPTIVKAPPAVEIVVAPASVEVPPVMEQP
jgi:hypothetical protein